GWPGPAVARVPAGTRGDPTWWAGFWSHDVAPHLLPAAVLRALALWWRPAGRWHVELAGAAGMVGASYVSRLHSASSENVLIPVLAAVALTAGLVLTRLTQLPWRPAWQQVLVGGLCLAQFGYLAYDPGHQLPPRSQTATARRLQAVLRGLPGE